MQGGKGTKTVIQIKVGNLVHKNSSRLNTLDITAQTRRKNSQSNAGTADAYVTDSCLTGHALNKVLLLKDDRI
jgi:hypothetical protein